MKEQRRLSHMVKGSSNYNKQRRKVALAHEKVRNQRKDWQHKESLRLASLYDRVWVCPECGCIIDRDINAAINIKNEGLKAIS